MKYLLALALLVAANTAVAQETCEVEVCNKIERLTLDPWSMIKDSMGEMCFDVVLPKEDAIVGKVLKSESRWYQGSTFNPTKKSVTKVKKVYSCK